MSYKIVNHSDNNPTYRFNLLDHEKGRIAKVVTRDGKEVESFTYEPSSGAYPVSGYVDGEFRTWTKEGEFYPSSRKHRDLNDLFMVRDSVEVKQVEVIKES